MAEKKLVHEKRELAADRLWVQGLLQGGLGVSLSLMLVGIILLFLEGDVFSHGIAMGRLFDGSFLPLGERLLGWGVLVLAMTPALRAVMLCLLWAREKDWKFVGVALFVILALGLSIALGGH